MQYALNVFKKSLVNHYKQATDPLITPPHYATTWGELISLGASRTNLTELQQIVGYLFTEIYEHKEHPVLLIADEINAIYAKKMENTSPYVLCAKISGKPLRNGYKLLSGTSTK